MDRLQLSRLLPRALRDRLAQARRDVRSLAAQLRGDVTGPVARRRSAPTRAAANARETTAARGLTGRLVHVEDIVRETADAVTLVLGDPTGVPFAFSPGQFFTLCLTVDGAPLRRAYSASSSAHTRDRLHLTIKRVAGGRVSNHLVDALAPGATLSLLGPSGSFTVAPDASARRRLVLLAGGSGITPMMSLARTLLPVESATRIDLVYGNRGLADILFAEQLAALAAAHAGRFTVRHVLSDPPAAWEGGVGLLGRDVVEAELARLDPFTDDVVFFVCGPEPMMAAVRAALRARGVDPARIVEERFSQPHLRDAQASTPPSAQPITIVRSDGARTTVIAAAGDTLLEAGLAAGAPLAYSCAMGGCAACKVRLVDGEVEMEEPNCLGPDERAAGWVLACVGRARTPVTVEVQP